MAARSLRIGVFAIVAFAAGLILARVLLPSQPAMPQTLRATVLPAPKALPTLALVDQDGRALGSDFFRGHWTLVFFGFTACPDVCPTTLAMLRKVNQGLASLPPAQRPRVLLISVDPERDDAARLRDYVHYFDPSFLAATGDLAGVDAAAGAFGVPYTKVAQVEGGYTVDHGSAIFVVGPSGGIVAVSTAPHDAATFEADYRAIVARSGTGS